MASLVSCSRSLMIEQVGLTMKESSSSVVLSDLLKSYVDLNGSAKKDNNTHSAKTCRAHFDGGCWKGCERQKNSALMLVG